MDYKKEYEKALDNFKKIKDANKDNKDLVDFIEYKYPELKENKDERIRKALIHLINEQDGFLTAINGISVKDVIAWLEKQGEQQNKVSIWKHWNNGIAGNGEGKLVYLIKSGNTYMLSSCLGFECDYIELSELDKLYIEKQGEQKPVDKVEPKFKVGDWIVEPLKDKPDYLWHIDRIKDDCYWYDAISAGVKIAYANQECHLWTIQDAKDGDVLANDTSIIIFRKLGNDFWNDVVDYYVGYSHSLDKIVIQSGKSHYGKINKVTFKPATKEQRDLLFQKVKEAGYEWNVVKKN